MNQIISPDQTATIQHILSKSPQIVACYFFGSRVKGSDRPNSDLDVALVCTDKTGLSPVDLSFAIGKIIPNPQADVTTLDLTDDPVLLIQVINGKVFYQQSVNARATLETRILQVYEDTCHFRQIRDHYLKQSFTIGTYAH